MEYAERLLAGERITVTVKAAPRYFSCGSQKFLASVARSSLTCSRWPNQGLGVMGLRAQMIASSPQNAWVSVSTCRRVIDVVS